MLTEMFETEGPRKVFVTSEVLMREAYYALTGHEWDSNELGN